MINISFLICLLILYSHLSIKNILCDVRISENLKSIKKIKIHHVLHTEIWKLFFIYTIYLMSLRVWICYLIMEFLLWIINYVFERHQAHETRYLIPGKLTHLQTKEFLALIVELNTVLLNHSVILFLFSNLFHDFSDLLSSKWNIRATIDFRTCSTINFGRCYPNWIDVIISCCLMLLFDILIRLFQDVCFEVIYAVQFLN